MRRSLLFTFIAVAIFGLGVFLFLNYTPPIAPTTQELSAASVAATTSPSTTPATSTQKETRAVPANSTKITTKATGSTTGVASTSPASQIERIQNPYPTPPASFDNVNALSRSAVVNILCEPQGGSLQPISGSGVIIDPRGVILTNAHVAQYVLLSESPQIDLTCFIRNGSPATARWTAQVLYIPPVWVDKHYQEIIDSHPTGTGEHDYALLYIDGSVDGSALPAQFPYLTIDTRSAIAFPGDQVLVASYPAEFLGGIAAQFDLYGVSSVTTVKQFLTFSTSTPDVLSLGGIIEAQSGSSGGAVVNAWERLVGLIATTSTGTTTASRDLRAISLSYINTDIAAQTGQNLSALLQGDPTSEVQSFTSNIAPALVQLYLAELTKNNTQQ